VENLNKLNKVEKDRIVERNVDTCKDIASNYIRTWKTIVNGEIVEGCAYLRLSTDAQVSVEKGSLEQQVYIAIDEAESRSKKEGVNYKITEFYIEPGLTGRNDRRPEFTRMKRCIKKGRHKFVVVKEIARLFRDAGLWKAFFKHCIDSDCEMMIRGFPFNPNDPTQILQLDILAAFAEYESNLISKRTRESNYSAMVSSGKFNSTHKVLGLDQRIVNGEEKVGFYVANIEELKIVVWIMETFLKYSSYQKVLEECSRFEIINKTGKPFKLNSLKTLLTNKKYVGVWVINSINKEKNQDRLMPYDRYQEIELPHGELLDRELWDKVQERVESIRGRNGKNTRINRVYPLQGILKVYDGSNFHGTSGTPGHKDSSRKVFYYGCPNLVVCAPFLE
jgi:site-specific DNA recombinase